MKDKTNSLNIRAHPNLIKIVKRFLETSSTYLNLSEFTRAALREKIQRDAPWLFEELTRDTSDSNI